ncbi:MAG: PAS domain S-box protein, partial [Chloroflexi bacterium]|nr:PAS domain S-box protein [Chloroflexota bacterium]
MDEKDGQKDRVSRTGQSAHRSRTTRHNRERANDARLAWSALDAVQVSVYGVTPEGSFFYVNDSACASLGYTRDELLRMTLADVDPDCPASARQAHWDRLKKHRTLNFESRHRRKDGTTFPVEIADSYVQCEGRELEFALARDLTMQERAQQALKNSEEKYRSLFEQSREAIALVDPTGRTLEVNQAWLDLSGYSRDELSGFNAAEGWANPEERKDFLRRVAATGYVEDEVRFKKKDGTVMDCDLSVVEWKDEHGNTVAYQTLVLDITERKNAEEKLRSGEERYRELFEHSRDAITLVAPDGRILDVNPAWLNLHGYSRDELPGLNAVDIYANPEDREDFLRRIAGAGFVEGEVRLKKKDGTVMDCHMVLVARKDDEGNVVAYQGLVRDITEQKRAQQALKDREEKFRSLFEQSMDAILISTPDGSSMDANHAWLDLFGYSRDELPGLNEVDMYANPQDRDDFVRRIAPTGVLIDNEVRLKKKDGTVMDCQRSVVARKDEQGNIVAYQGVIHDITEQKRAQEELRSSEERYRLVADNTMDVIWSMGLDLVFTYVNPAIYQILGYAPEQWVGSSLADYCSGEHLQQMKDIIGHEIANPHAHTGVLFETVMRHKNGDSLPVEIHGKVVVDGNGRPVGLQGTTIDIAERRLTEEALRQSEERYRVMFENSGTAMVIVEEDTTISLVNHQFETLSGYSRQEIEGKKRWTEFIVAGDVERMRRHHRARRAGEPAPEEYVFRLVDRHGNARDMYINVGLIPGTVRSIASLRDITEERKAQDRLQESFIDLVEVMTRSMESLDPYTSGHQRRVARLADLVGRELGMDDDRLQGLYIGALL